jgi:3-hydroxybutyryl-CoA dehydrogenase
MSGDAATETPMRTESHPIRDVAVVGCGLMGRGITEACARAGLGVTAIKATRGSVDPAREAISRSLEGQVKKGKLAPLERDKILGRIDFTSQLESVGEADLVIESGLETILIKQQLLEVIEQLARPYAILATNTSALPLIEISARLTWPERFLGLHFFSPAVQMKLCEVAPTPSTDPRVVERVMRFVESIDKTPVVVRDEPGYIVNRLLVPYLLLAMNALEEGVAGQEAIDTAMRLGCGHPVGPLALADLIGLDVVFSMAKSMGEAFNDSRYSAPSILRRLVLANHLGKKSGTGFYLYANGTIQPNPNVLALRQGRPGGAAAA